MTFTTAVTPSTRAKLVLAKTNLFTLDETSEHDVPVWLIVDALLDAGLQDPCHVVEVVRARVQALAAQG
jgi:hypothetical protein